MRGVIYGFWIWLVIMCVAVAVAFVVGATRETEVFDVNSTSWCKDC